MKSVLVALLLGLLVPVPVSPDTWPLDTYVTDKIDTYLSTLSGSSYPGYRDNLLRQAVATEQNVFREAEVTLIGVVTSFSEMTAPDGSIWTGTDVSVEQCVAGECPESTITFFRPRGRFSTGWERSAITRAEDGTHPEVGKRYMFVGLRFTHEPWVLRGGNRFQRYLIEDGIVVSKGVSAEEFVGQVESLLRHVRAQADSTTGIAEPMEDGDRPQPPN